MAEIHQHQVGGLNPEFPGLEEASTVHGAFYLGPILGMIGVLFNMVTYNPLDNAILYWIGATPCLIGWMVIINARKRKKNAPALVSAAKWLSLGSLCIPLVLLANGALDHSPIERHQQIVTRTILEHGRHGSTYYYLEVSSWRRGRTHEKVMVSERKYLDSTVGDPVVVETHAGALGIPLLVSVHRPD